MLFYQRMTNVHFTARKKLRELRPSLMALILFPISTLHRKWYAHR